VFPFKENEAIKRIDQGAFSGVGTSRSVQGAAGILAAEWDDVRPNDLPARRRQHPGMPPRSTT